MIDLDLSARSPGQQALIQACPLVCVPPREPHVPLTQPGRRWVMGGDGVYLEARSLALHAIIKVSSLSTCFGQVDERVEFINGPVPASLSHACGRLALAAGQNETAALIHWNPEEGQYELSTPQIISASTGHVTYRDESRDELLVIDFHSHGHHGAFFSGDDDASDLSRMGPYIASVAGCCQSEDSLEVRTRLCLSPYLVDWQQIKHAVHPSP